MTPSRKIIFPAFGVLLLAAAITPLNGCGGRRDSGPAPAIAASSSYLECAVRDLLGPQTAVLRLAEPGMCPGHFDIRPSQVQRIRSCRLLARFDFQSSLDRQLESIGAPTVAQVTASGGMCEPHTYLAICKQLAHELTQARFVDPANAASRLAAIEQRVNASAGAARKALADAGLLNAPVLSSEHQAAFCRWLGLRVVAVVSGTDTASVRAVDDALKLARQADCKIVIANRPEGTGLAEAMADRLAAAVVVFDNFPDLGEREPDFDGLVQENVRRLIAGARR